METIKALSVPKCQRHKTPTGTNGHHQLGQPPATGSQSPFPIDPAHQQATRHIIQASEELQAHVGLARGSIVRRHMNTCLPGDPETWRDY